MKYFLAISLVLFTVTSFARSNSTASLISKVEKMGFDCKMPYDNSRYDYRVFGTRFGRDLITAIDIKCRKDGLNYLVAITVENDELVSIVFKTI